MIKVVIGGHVVKLYDSVDDMPIVNFQKYNKFLLIDSGIGSTLDDYNNHILKMFKYIQVNNLQDLAQELANTRQLMFMINQEISPKYLAFAALIAEFDGKPVTDLSDDNLKAILGRLKEIKHKWLVHLLEKVKKKVESELSAYFPSMFNSAKEKEAYDKLRERTMLELEELITGKDKAEDISKIDEFFLSLHKPRSFEGPKSAEIMYDKSFENTCLALQFKLKIHNAKKLTVFEYYSAVENLNKLVEHENKSSQSLKRIKRR